MKNGTGFGAMKWERIEGHAPANVPPQHVVIITQLKFAAAKVKRDQYLTSEGGPTTERMIRWDMEIGHDHQWTIREALLSQGFIPTPPAEMNSDQLSNELNLMVTLMWHMGYGLVNDRHLSKFDLYARLYYKILDEKCLMIFDTKACSEMIDCLHPLDTYPGSTEQHRVYSRCERSDRYGKVWEEFPLPPTSEGEHGCWFLKPGDRIIG